MVVEKYTKALMSSIKENEYVEFFNALKKVADVSGNSKFILIVKSPLISLDEKVKFLVEIAGLEDKRLMNFFKLLLINKRIDIIKNIVKRLYEKVSFYLKTFNGVVEGKIDEVTLKKLEDKLSQKFNAHIKLKLKKSDINGVKVFVDVLNVEVALDENKIKKDILTQILKAI